MAHDNRSPNIEDKPNAKVWLEKHPKPAVWFNRALQTLLALYDGDRHGYVNISGRAEYRFNYHKSAGEIYVCVLCQAKQAVVRLFPQSDGNYEEISIGSEDDIQNLFSLVSDKRYATAKFTKPLQTDAQYEDDFQNEIAKSTGDPDARDKRLKNANKVPKPGLVQISRYPRNPDVVSKRLELAKGKCDKCGNEAPFKRASDGSPYLEVHHKVSLSEGGTDELVNTVALCPNCHREQHYGKPSPFL